VLPHFTSLIRCPWTGAASGLMHHPCHRSKRTIIHAVRTIIRHCYSPISFFQRLLIMLVAYLIICLVKAGEICTMIILTFANIPPSALSILFPFILSQVQTQIRYLRVCMYCMRPCFVTCRINRQNIPHIEKIPPKFY
jgi:hypothetical protein